jgi:uncharacterized protein (DUF302 family)
MSYYYSRSLSTDFDLCIENLTTKLKEKGFGVLSEINVEAILKKKIKVDFHKYIILGACNPHFAHQALLLEDKVGVMLPCNVIIQQRSPKELVEVSAVDPVSSMMAIENENLFPLLEEVRALLVQVIDELE